MMDSAERYYREALADLHRSYHAATQPLLEALAKIDAYKAPRPILMTLEEAKRHGFIK